MTTSTSVGRRGLDRARRRPARVGRSLGGRGMRGVMANFPDRPSARGAPLPESWALVVAGQMHPFALALQPPFEVRPGAGLP
jgi:hypothetical protein